MNNLGIQAMGPMGDIKMKPPLISQEAWVTGLSAAQARADCKGRAGHWLHCTAKGHRRLLLFVVCHPTTRGGGKYNNPKKRKENSKQIQTATLKWATKIPTWFCHHISEVGNLFHLAFFRLPLWILRLKISLIKSPLFFISLCAAECLLVWEVGMALLHLDFRWFISCTTSGVKYIAHVPPQPQYSSCS